jgi:hypothetical protein
MTPCMNGNDQIWARDSTRSRPNYAPTYSHSCSSGRSSGICDISKTVSGRLPKQSAGIRAHLTTRSQIQTTSTSVPNADPTRTSETGGMRSHADSRSMYHPGGVNGLQLRRIHICVPIATTIAGEPDRSRNRRISRACALDGGTLRHVLSVDNGTRKLVLCSSPRTPSPSMTAPRWRVSSPRFPGNGKRSSRKSACFCRSGRMTAIRPTLPRWPDLSPFWTS